MPDMSPRAARLIRGLKQEEVAELLCVHRVTYLRMEKDPKLFTIAQAQQLCRAYGMTLDELFPIKNRRKGGRT